MAASSGLFRTKLSKLKFRMKERDLDIIMLQNWSNIFYMTGLRTAVMTRPINLIVPLNGDPVLIASKLLERTIRNEVRWIDDVRFWTEFKEAKDEEVYTPSDLIKDALNQIGIRAGKIGIEKGYFSVQSFERLKELLPSGDFSDCSDVLGSMRMVKYPEEIALLKRAIAITDSVFKIAVEDLVRRGRTELDVAIDILKCLLEKGAEGASFFPMVNSGRRSTLLSTRPSKKKICDKEIVLIDFGAVYEGYCADITRMAAVGDIPESQKELFKKILEIEEKTLRVIAPKKAACDIYNYAMTEFDREKLPRSIHRIGHGIGIDYHEGPFLGYWDETPLENGMVVAVEPGINLTDFGIRIEDAVLVTKKGCEILSKAPKDLYQTA